MKKIKLAIIGSGPAGYTAGIYAGRARLKPCLYTGVEIGGQLMYTTVVENFPGVTQGIQGTELMQNMLEQCSRFDVEISTEIISAVDFSSTPFKLWTGLPKSVNLQDFIQADQKQYQKLATKIKAQPHNVEAQAVIISTGSVSLKLNLPNEQKLVGRGISVCAVCDATFFKDKKVFVVGGGDSAMEDALALAKFTSEVTIVHRRDSFKASKIMQQRVFNNKQITVLFNSQVKAIIGEQKLEQLEIEVEGNSQTYPADGLFLAIGHKPMTKIFAHQVKLDQRGYVVTAQSVSQDGVQLAKQRLNQQGLIPLPSMTTVEGVFAAGDVVDLRYRQAIFASGMGCGAALDAEVWLGRLLHS